MTRRDEILELLEQVRSGRVKVDEAAAKLDGRSIDPLGFAQLDLQRSVRCGFPEVVYAPGKTVEHLGAIVERLIAADEGCLVTRVSDEQAVVLRRIASGTIDPVARTFWLPPSKPRTVRGQVLVLSAGTSDLPVAREALVTAEAFATRVELCADVGVAGLHRLLAQMDRIRAADVIVVVAGMEGALPSVVGGLAACPVIAVPTSVGYGANLAGWTALCGMLTSCAANVAVVNIDAGFCGGYLAGLIARRTNHADHDE